MPLLLEALGLSNEITGVTPDQMFWMHIDVEPLGGCAIAGPSACPCSPGAREAYPSPAVTPD